MLWLTWHMWILLLLAFIGGVITGWVLRSRSDEPERPQLSHSERTPDPGPAPAGTASAAAAASTPSEDPTSGPASEAGHVEGHAPESEARRSESPEDSDTHEDTAKDEESGSDRLAAAAPQQAPGADAAPVSKGPASETSAGPGAPAPDAKTSPAPDAKSGMAMTAPMQAPGADAGPVTDGPQGETSAGPGAPDAAPSDDLTQIKGLGPKAAEKLNGAGVTKVSQIANWSDADVERYDALINGRGRIKRDDWVGQAKQIAG
ncbi:MAG: hypothetical protein RKE49_15515 [Oceanicaulis sp.]